MTCIGSVLVGLRLKRSEIVQMVPDILNCSCENIDRRRNFCSSCGRKNNEPITREVLPEEYAGYPVVTVHRDPVYLAVHRTQTKDGAQLDLAWLEQERVKMEQAIGDKYRAGQFGFFPMTLHDAKCSGYTGNVRCASEVVIGLRATYSVYERKLISCDCCTERTQKYCSDCGMLRRSIVEQVRNQKLFAAIDKETDNLATIGNRRLWWTEPFFRLVYSHECSKEPESVPVDRFWGGGMGDIVVAIDGFHHVFREDPLSIAEVQKEKDELLKLIPDAQESNFGVFGQARQAQT